MDCDGDFTRLIAGGGSGDLAEKRRGVWLGALSEGWEGQQRGGWERAGKLQRVASESSKLKSPSRTSPGRTMRTCASLIGAQVPCPIVFQTSPISRLDSVVQPRRNCEQSTSSAEDSMKWVTRANVKVDRVACPWLIRTFVDPEAEFIFVPVDQVEDVVKKTGVIPYDTAGAELGHHGDECSFDAIVKKYKITTARSVEWQLLCVAPIQGVRTPESPGLEAIAEG